MKVKSILLDELSGKLGKGLVFRNTSRGTIMSKAPTGLNQRTELQADVRCRTANASSNYRLYRGRLKQAFESKDAGVSDFNMYVGVNFSNPVYITKGMRIAGCCVLADYTFSVGSLPPIAAELNDGGILVSNVSLGSLVIDENTSVADFSIALIENNVSLEFEEQDQVTYFFGVQQVDAQGMPRATMTAVKVILNVDDETPLWDIVGSAGFQTVGGYLGMSAPLDNSGGAWVHSRDKVSGDTLVSTQNLIVVSDILDDYRSYAAMRASADSYGGITSTKVYLNPKSSESLALNTASGSGSGQQSGGSGSQTGGSEQSQNGDSQSPGSETDEGGDGGEGLDKD